MIGCVYVNEPHFGVAHFDLTAALRPVMLLLSASGAG